MKKHDLPAADLDRRVVTPGKIGFEGRVPKAAKDLASQIGLPHKDAWLTKIAIGSTDGKMAVEKAIVWPIWSEKDVAALVADLRKAGLSGTKKSDLETFLIKQAKSPNGLVLAARPARMRNASAVLSLFREIEVGRDNDVSYHVHVEEMIDFSTGGIAGDSLKTCFLLQAEADIAVLAHGLKEAGYEGTVSLLCESNNDDTHDAAPILADILDEALNRINANPKFTETAQRVDFEPANYACHR
jgi:hypothetical protein